MKKDAEDQQEEHSGGFGRLSQGSKDDLGVCIVIVIIVIIAVVVTVAKAVVLDLRKYPELFGELNQTKTPSDD